MRKLHAAGILVPLLALASPLCAQGFYIESTHSSSPKGADKLYYMPKMARMADADGSRITILRLDKETMYNLRPAKKTYTEMTFAEMKALMGNARTSIAEMMKKRLASMPPEQRKKLEDQLAAMNSHAAPSEPTYETSSTGEHKSISGYDCEKYVVKRNGKPYQTVWATRQINGFEAIRHDFEDWTNKVASAVGTKATALQWYKGINGFPIQTESEGYVNTVTKVERTAVPSSEFEVPAGYKKVARSGESTGF